MCRGKNFCSELNPDPSKWDKRTTLRRPEWMSDQIDLFIKGVQLFFQNNINGAQETIRKIKDHEITEWYIEHGQMSGMHRKNFLNLPEPKPIPSIQRDPLRSPRKYQKKVFLRDNYKCRYCGEKIISQDFLKLFSKALDVSTFKRGKTNLTTHGIFHLTWPVADHVIPWVNGGKTDLDNLVTSCAPCNYGKAGYTIEQIGLDNPFSHKTNESNWDGFEKHINSLKKIV